MRTQDNTLALLSAIGDKVGRCLTESGKVVKAAAKDGAPEATGDLKRGIKVEAVKNKVTIGSTVPYGAVQEIDQPHLRPALHGKKLAIGRIFGKT